jgi:DNA-binding PadR family transcriptional regulator
VMTEKKRRARIYQITEAGQKQLATESARWNSFSNGVALVLRHA